MHALRRVSGPVVNLGQQLAEGGEGRIFEIPGEPTLLAKIYLKQLDQEHHRKLVAMVKMTTSALTQAAAWPTDLLIDQREKTIGFMMPRIDAPGNIDQLSHPAEQRRTFPTIDYGFLVHVSMNLMRAASVIHASGCVIGDVNQSNIRVLADGTVRFIDADSFQICSNGLVFPCRVGTPLYTPPELQGTRLAAHRRTTSHDGFGLAVLVFQLLMCGRHPFAGVPADNNPRTIEQAIAAGMFAYSDRARAMSPPPGALPLSALGALAPLFERAFLCSDRPQAHEWLMKLDRARATLLGCSRNRRHRRLVDGPCPLCALSRDPLPDVGTVVEPGDLGGLSIGQLLKESATLAPNVLVAMLS